MKKLLTRKLRKMVGKGRTRTERGWTTLFFSRGLLPFTKALSQLQATFGEPEIRNSYYVFHMEIVDVEIRLKPFGKNENNFEEFS